MAQNKTSYDLDFTGVETTLSLPEGTHAVKVGNAEFTKASTGSDQLCITYKNNDGASIRAWYSLVPTALWKVKQVLIALGIPCEGKIRLEAKQLIGRTCKITVEIDENNDKYKVVTDVQPLGGEAPAEVGYTPTAVPQQAPAPIPQTTPVPPVQTAQQPIGNLPPWMQNGQAPAVQSAPALQSSGNPAGNLPPWMR